MGRGSTEREKLRLNGVQKSHLPGSCRGPSCGAGVDGRRRLLEPRHGVDERRSVAQREDAEVPLELVVGQAEEERAVHTAEIEV